MANKLDNFPPVHYISVDYSVERREKLKQKFSEFGITNLTGHIFKKYDDVDHIIESSYIDRLSSGSRAAVTSHLKAIKEWYNTTNENYAFFCEDDVSLELVQYWNFTWNDFYNHLPENWQIIQLAWLRDSEFYRFKVGFRTRCWCDWSGCAYLIKREHAKKLIETYYPNNQFILNLSSFDLDHRDEWAKIPVIETVIFTPFEELTVYGAPLFTEDQNLPSSYVNSNSEEEKNQFIHFGHSYSYEENLNWWKMIGHNQTIDEFMKT